MKRTSAEQLPLPLDAAPAPHCEVHLAGSVAAMWEEVQRPWFERAAIEAWRREEPTLVVVPFRSDAYFLKSRLLEHGISVLGVRFLTPELRTLLAGRLVAPARIPPGEHLRLLIAVVAEEHARSNPGAWLAARAVENAPEALLQAWDQLRASGNVFARLGPAEFRSVISDFEQRLAACGFDDPHAVDRNLGRLARAARRVFADLLITGFTGAQWPLFPLLEAAVCASAKATVVLRAPRFEAAGMDQAWIGTWEQSFGPASTVSDMAEAAPLAELFSGATSGAAERVHLLIGRNTFAQAKAVATMAMQFLASGNCSRLGIFVPGAGALARLISSLLCAHEIPHNDTVAHLAPGPLEDPAWPLWLALQGNPRLPALLGFLRAFGDTERFFPTPQIERVESVLTRVRDEWLIDDLAVIGESLARSPAPEDALYARGLKAIAFLPERATVAEFNRAAAGIFETLGWAERLVVIEELSRGWRDHLPLAFSRRLYLRWLGDIVDSRQPVREVPGNHPYSRVHLLTYARGESQEWSHAIFAGLNEGEWPPAHDEGGYLGEEQIAELNRGLAMAKTRAMREGVQGEGHVTVAPGQTLCLGPWEKGELARRTFNNIVESVGEQIAVAASLYQEATPSRLYQTGEFFNRLHRCVRGRSLSADAALGLAETTERWVESSKLWSQPPGSPGEVTQTRIAHEARWEEGTRFGPYEFALRETSPRTMVLAATDWEKALKQPAIVWMKKFLGVEARREAGSWSLATGLWVHRWLAAVSGCPGENRLVQFPAPALIPDLVEAQAAGVRREVEALMTACQRTVPDWWISGWRNAVYTAQSFAKELARLSDWPLLGTEWNLDPPVAVELAPGKMLRLRGRIDLLLARGLGSDDESAIDGCEALIIDYKTGNRKPLTSRRSVGDEARAQAICAKLRIGAGLQLALYGLALKQLGAREAGMAFLALNLPWQSPELRLDDLTVQERFWLELHEMQESGVFGMRGELRPDFGYGDPYPLASLDIDPELIEEKWEATHPGFVDACTGEGDEEENG